MATLTTLCALLAPAPAYAIINPRFTPADLVRSASQIVQLEVTVPRANTVRGTVAATLKGKPLAAKTIQLDIDERLDLTRDDVVAAFAGAEAAVAVLVVQDGPEAKPKTDAPTGAIQVGTRWFAVFRRDENWRLGLDRQDLFAVWAGSAEKLVDATRYVLADPTARFPVRSDITWTDELHLGKVRGRPTACLAVDFGEPIGTCALVLSESGDHVYPLQPEASEAGTGAAAPPSGLDVVGRLKLNTASKLAVPGDFNGDGRLDLACWDGKTLRVATQLAGGSFDVRPSSVQLSECLSLDVLDVGSEKGAGLLAGTSGGPVLLIPDGRGNYVVRYVVRPLPAVGQSEATEGLGAGGFCVVADFDLDGRADIMQVFAQGILVFDGEGAGRFKPPRKMCLDLVIMPSSAVCGDFDTDGRLDLVVGGQNGLVLLAGKQDRTWANVTSDTGELAYHGNMNRPAVIGSASCDVNNDGRQGVALFYPNQVPMLFFNRGFACFGWARELNLSETGASAGNSLDPFDPFADPFANPTQSRLKAADALQHGQTAATVLDYNVDGIQDLLGVDLQNELWVLLGGREAGRALGLTLALSAEVQGPLTVRVSDGSRLVGIHVLRPGRPAFIGRANPGPLNFEWTDRDGRPKSRRAIVIKPTRLEIGP